MPTETMTPSHQQPAFALVLRAMPGHYQAPPHKRLARLLKTMKRAYGMQAVSCRPVAPPPKPEGKP